MPQLFHRGLRWDKLYLKGPLRGSWKRGSVRDNMKGRKEMGRGDEKLFIN